MKGLPARGRYGRRDLVEGRVGNLIRFDLRSSFNERFEELRDFRIGRAAVGFRILCSVPQADAEGILAASGDEADFVLEPLLLSKQRNDALLEPPRVLRSAIWLQIHGDSACKHLDLLGRDQGAFQITTYT